MIHDLYKLISKWRIVGVTPHDLINWFERKIELCYLDERLNDGSIKVWVSVRHPDHEPMQRDTKLYNELRLIMTRMKSPNIIRMSDIKDRFISHGKMWLVLPAGRVVEESTVRVYADRCIVCKAKPADQRQHKLLVRQEMRCFSCFCKTFNDEWPYASSTFRSTRRSGQYEASYDPATGEIEYRTLPNRV